MQKGCSTQNTPELSNMDYFILGKRSEGTLCGQSSSNDSTLLVKTPATWRRGKEDFDWKLELYDGNLCLPVHFKVACVVMPPCPYFTFVFIAASLSSTCQLPVSPGDFTFTHLV